MTALYYNSKWGRWADTQQNLEKRKKERKRKNQSFYKIMKILIWGKGGSAKCNKPTYNLSFTNHT